MEKETRKNFSKSGFSLIETLVALSILSIALIGPMSLATNSISNAMISHNQLIAFYLAQEAMEFIISIRDSNYDQRQDWLLGFELYNCCNTIESLDGCDIDVKNNQVTVYSGAPLKYFTHPVDGYSYYSYSGYGNGENTVFYRTVKIINPVDYNGVSEYDEAKVEVKVWWDDKMGLKEITLEENIFNWNQ